MLILDVGGTFIKCSDGREIPVDSDGTEEVISAALAEAVRGEYERIRIAIPGPFDYRRGIFLMKHKYAAVYGRTFREIAGIPESVELEFVHDVVGPLMGELERDPSLRKGTVALITLGTGLGFAVARDGVVSLAEDLSPAESLWDLPYGDGTLEDYVSKRGILRFAQNDRKAQEEISVRELSEMARRGDPKALGAFREAGRHLSLGARPVLESLGVKKVIFAGQISKSLDLIAPDFGEGVSVVLSSTIANNTKR